MKIALLILYNHRYDKNIPRLEKLYEGKFSHIFHIMPFYDGDLPNVIPVYESSYYFQSYIAQAYHHIKHMGFTHYFVVADDMVLNPNINENNLFEITGIAEDACYINDIREIYDTYFFKNHFKNYHSFKSYRVKQKGVEVENILPDRETAIKIFKGHCLRTDSLSFDYLIRSWLLITRQMIKTRRLRATIRVFFRGIKDILSLNKKISYPLVLGYSDILLIPCDKMSQFVTLCGAFAATNLFVEFAIPTALVLSTNKINTNTDLQLRSITQIYRCKDIPPHEINSNTQVCEAEAFYSKYNYQLSSLLDNYPSDVFFIHPIKLSQWK